MTYTDVLHYLGVLAFLLLIAVVGMAVFYGMSGINPKTLDDETDEERPIAPATPTETRPDEPHR